MHYRSDAYAGRFFQLRHSCLCSSHSPWIFAQGGTVLRLPAILFPQTGPKGLGCHQEAECFGAHTLKHTRLGGLKYQPRPH